VASDITYIRTHEGFLYLAVVIDLFSRRVIGWSMQGRAYTDLPLQALLMAVWRRKPKTKVYVHSDQGSQFTSYEWQEFLEQHNLAPSMRRRANCWDNDVVESFFNLLKRERIRRKKIQNTRRSPPRRVQLHRVFLHPAAQTRSEWHAVTDRLRTAAKTETARRLAN
jgi:putative transposase